MKKNKSYNSIFVKQGLSFVLIIAMLFSVLSLGQVFGGNERDQLDELNKKIDNLQNQLKQGKAKEKQLASEIKNLNALIRAAEGEIYDLGKEIKKLAGEIQVVEGELAQKQNEIQSQNKEMGKRIRVMYKNGEVGILEVLLNSESMLDFLTNLDMAQRIFHGDVKMLEELERQHESIENHKGKLELMKADLDAKQKAEAAKRGKLEASKNDVSKLKAEVATDIKALEKQVDKLNEEANALIAEILRLQGTGEYVGGVLMWPTPGHHRITSEFGYRVHPILKVKKLHTGLDIGVPSGSKVVAANAGKVIKAAWNNSYGYMVMIDHGGGIVTLYAHNSQLKVSTGDIVSKGQLVALSGSTGVSTGPHLHFEVRINGEYKNPRLYL